MTVGESSRKEPYNKYTGETGVHATMAQLFSRGYNIASPTVDIGDDLFAINEETGAVDRIQVKSARQHTRASRQQGRLEYDFNVLRSRIMERHKGAGADPYFIFVLLSDSFPVSYTYVIIQRAALEHLVQENNLEKTLTKRRQIHLTIEYLEAEGKVGFISGRGTRVPMDRYKDNWSPWPVLRMGGANPNKLESAL